MREPYSVLMSVYKNERPDWLRRSIESMLSQTVKPDEFVIVKDGKLTPELDAVLDEYKEKKIFKIIQLEKNMGLGLALKSGLEACSNEIVARMDSDDYCDPKRMEKQLELIEKDEWLGVVGCNVKEFMNGIDDVRSVVILPETTEQIMEFAKERSPFRHPAVTMRKTAIMDAGGYRHFPYFEDYDLFVRLLIYGYNAYNIQECLVYMQIGDDFYRRRGGGKYMSNIKRFEKYLLKIDFISRGMYLKNMIVRGVVSLSPNSFRKRFYKKFLREDA